MSDNVTVVRGIYAALSRGDLEGALKAGVPDAEHDWSRSVGPYRGIYRGLDATRAFWREYLEAVEDLTFEVEETIEAGPHVVAMVRAHLRGRHSGVEVVARGPHLWTLRDGKVVRFVLYQERSEALQAVGLVTEANSD
jgi:ketosteroid isomerase-like protein